MKIYSPLLCITGQRMHDNALFAPHGRYAFTDDYQVAIDLSGELDAPERVPSGSVKAQPFLTGEGALLVGHVWRPDVLEHRA